MNLRLILLLSAIVMGASAAAAEAAPECFTKEIDPQTKRVYQNSDQYDADLIDLWAKAPAAPGIMRLYRGYEVAKAESSVRKIGSDKRRHCYVGCRIANEVGHDVAVYAGYYKEDQDLLDCRESTHFDLKDIEATVTGADLAAKNPGRADAAYCKSECQAAIRR